MKTLIVVEIGPKSATECGDCGGPAGLGRCHWHTTGDKEWERGAGCLEAESADGNTVLARQIERLRRFRQYADHTRFCGVMTGAACDCGYSDLLQELPA